MKHIDRSQRVQIAQRSSRCSRPASLLIGVSDIRGGLSFRISLWTLQQRIRQCRNETAQHNRLPRREFNELNATAFIFVHTLYTTAYVCTLWNPKLCAKTATLRLPSLCSECAVLPSITRIVTSCIMHSSRFQCDFATYVRQNEWQNE